MPAIKLLLAFVLVFGFFHNAWSIPSTNTDSPPPPPPTTANPAEEIGSTPQPDRDDIAELMEYLNRKFSELSEEIRQLKVSSSGQNCDIQYPPISFSCQTDSRNDYGDRYAATCPPNCRYFAVWGTTTYTDDSSVCNAAIHSGKIDAAVGGRVTVLKIPGQPSYRGSNQKGITTSSYGRWAGSFTFL